MKELTCATCGGTCCRVLTLVVSPTGNHPEYYELLKARSIDELPKHKLVFESACGYLNRRAGTCSAYDIRPQACQTFQVGGPECLEVIRSQRPALMQELLAEKGPQHE